MTTPTYTITTAKGSFTGTLREVCAWQAEMQGSYPTIDRADSIGFGDDLRDMEVNFGDDGQDMEISVNLDDADEPSPLLRALMAEFGAPTLGKQDSGRVWFSWIASA